MRLSFLSFHFYISVGVHKLPLYGRQNNFPRFSGWNFEIKIWIFECSFFSYFESDCVGWSSANHGNKKQTWKKPLTYQTYHRYLFQFARTKKNNKKLTENTSQTCQLCVQHFCQKAFCVEFLDISTLVFIFWQRVSLITIMCNTRLNNFAKICALIVLRSYTALSPLLPEFLGLFFLLWKENKKNIQKMYLHFNNGEIYKIPCGTVLF